MLPPLPQSFLTDLLRKVSNSVASAQNIISKCSI
jgi:hypothetical protein